MRSPCRQRRVTSGIASWPVADPPKAPEPLRHLSQPNSEGALPQVLARHDLVVVAQGCVAIRQLWSRALPEEGRLSGAWRAEADRQCLDVQRGCDPIGRTTDCLIVATAYGSTPDTDQVGPIANRQVGKKEYPWPLPSGPHSWSKALGRPELGTRPDCRRISNQESTIPGIALSIRDKG